MAELVDAADSKSALSNKVLVQVRLEVPNQTAPFWGLFFYFARLCQLQCSFVLFFNKNPDELNKGVSLLYSRPCPFSGAGISSRVFL